MRLVFAGTPEPALPSLHRLIASPRHDVVAVLSRPDAAAGRRGGGDFDVDEGAVPALAIDAALDRHAGDDAVHGFLDGARAMISGVMRSPVGMGGALPWPALLRKLDRENPGYDA